MTTASLAGSGAYDLSWPAPSSSIDNRAVGSPTGCLVPPIGLRLPPPTAVNEY